MKEKITTAEFIEENEAEIKRQKIRELCESNHVKKMEIRKKISSLKQLVSKLKDLTGTDREDRVETR